MTSDLYPLVPCKYLRIRVRRQRQRHPIPHCIVFLSSVFGSHSGLGYVILTYVKRLSRLSFRLRLSAARWPTFTWANNGLFFCVFRFITVVFIMLFTTAKLLPSQKPHNTAFTVNLRKVRIIPLNISCNT